VSRSLAFRCDGDAEIGAGHVARCLPLAAAFAERGFDPVFVGAYSSLARWLLDRSGLPRVSPTPGPCGLGDGWDAAVIDTYTEPEDELCAAATARPVATLGEARRCPERGVVLDYHLDAPSGALADLPSERVVAGPQYAPLDPRLAAARRPRASVARVLVTVGGSAPARRLVPTIVEYVTRAFPAATVLVPDGAADGPRVEPLPSPVALVDVLPGVDLAVSAAGVTAYELACAGVPALVVALVENQQRVARACAEAGVALGLDGLRSDWAEQLEGKLRRLTHPAVRRAMADAGPRAFDGRGAGRAAREIEQRWADPGLAAPESAAGRKPASG
jgi:spore coat polysaccharide biosynthesis predicted glycosyltransferase SpsG